MYTSRTVLCGGRCKISFIILHKQFFEFDLLIHISFTHLGVLLELLDFLMYCRVKQLSRVFKCVFFNYSFVLLLVCLLKKKKKQNPELFVVKQGAACLQH